MSATPEPITPKPTTTPLANPAPDTPAPANPAERATAHAAAQRKIVNRLRRARGQLDAVIAAVEGGGPCRDVVTQLAAVSSALDRAGFTIVSSAMRDCLAEPEAQADQGLTPDELEKLFLMLA